jgi:hypothetical protein
MNINAAFPSKYVKSSEIPEEGLPVIIDRVEIEDVDGKGARKPVVYFRKAKKGLALNVTNAKKITSILGTADTDEWGGKPITLYRSETEYQGETVDCIRVRSSKNGSKPAPPVVHEPVTEELNEDSIPF